MSENSAVEVRFTLPFKRRLKSLSKHYRQIRKDIQPIIDELQAGNFVGAQIAGTNYVVFKVRAKNRLLHLAIRNRSYTNQTHLRGFPTFFVSPYLADFACICPSNSILKAWY
ncbi:MAG: hypothetical protein RID53_00500 [Coleofasciculus sp. B1-GNL1-01]|uniref:hypothetical protein n=1 Tax=Coleofasciculus sp. B1-GNL1-01 TaxID=3068484 RepID=UPI0032F22682